jgi:uncharacterized protein (TIGR02466 family)
MTYKEHVIPIFSTPLYFVDGEEETFKFNTEHLNFLKKANYVEAEHNYVTKDNQILNLEVFSDLKEFIQDHIIKYTEKFISKDQECEFEISSSWATKTKTGQFHNFHKHLTSVMSGVVNVTPNNVTIFSREIQGPCPFFAFDYKHYGTAFAEKVNVVQENSGCLLLFPSNVFHSVPPYELEEDRYSISFNVFPRGNFYTHPEQTIV